MTLSLAMICKQRSQCGRAPGKCHSFQIANVPTEGKPRYCTLGTFSCFSSKTHMGHIRDNILYGATSKYPPAKPGALELWPLKAAGGVAYAAAGVVSRSKRLLGALTRPQVQ